MNDDFDLPDLFILALLAIIGCVIAPFYWICTRLFSFGESSPEDNEFTKERSHEVDTGNSQTRPPAGRTETPDHPAPGGADADRELCPPAGANPASSPNLALSPEDKA